MLKSAIILAGARKSGKSKTLVRMIIKKLHGVKGEIVHSYKGKRIAIYTSSPQEQRYVGFCNVEAVRKYRLCA
jgi:hypothetical protein